MEFRKIRKQGNSLAVNLPKNYLYHLDMKVNDWVAVSLRDREMVFQKMSQKIVKERSR